jgi:hypothetical protein
MDGTIATYAAADGSDLQLSYSSRAGALAIRRVVRELGRRQAELLVTHIIDLQRPYELSRLLAAIWEAGGLPGVEGGEGALGRLETRRALLAFLEGLTRSLEAAAEDLLSASGRVREAQDSLYICRNALDFMRDAGLPQDGDAPLRQALCRLRHELSVGLLQDLLDAEQLRLYRVGDRQAMSDEARAAVEEAEQSFQDWVVDLLLEEEIELVGELPNRFERREAAIQEAAFRYLDRSETRRSLNLLLQSAGNKMAQGWLQQLERWWLSIYDVESYSRAHVQRTSLESRPEGKVPRLGRLESVYRPTTAMFCTVLLFMALPFALGSVFYDAYQGLFDAWITAMILLVYMVGAWFLVWRFVVKRDITFFHLAVPRLLASVVVGYVPLLAVEDSWHIALKMDVARLALFCPMMLLLTFLYLVIETRHRLGDMRLAMNRAFNLLMLGLVEATAIGLVTCNLVADVMFERFEWDIASTSIGAMPTSIGITVGGLGLTAYPVVLLVFTCGSLFVGIFLQLLWEEKQLTEPI